MTREQTISKMMDMANELLTSEYSKMKEMEIWTICLDWNSEHEDEEIFMCEHTNDDNVVDGFCIEDDYWVFEI